MTEVIRNSGKKTTVFTLGIGEESREERAARWATDIDSVMADRNINTGGIPKFRNGRNNGEIIIKVNPSVHDGITGPKGRPILKAGEVIILQEQLPDFTRKKARKNKDKKPNGNRRRRPSKR